MSDPATVSVAAKAATAAGLMATVTAFSFGGVDGYHFLLGAGCYVVGSAGRYSVKIGAALEAGQPGMWQYVGRCVAAFSSSLFIGPFASLLVYLGANKLGYEGDAAIGIGLAVAAFRGTEAILSLVNALTRFLPQGQKP
jgi:hypothetical protein